MLKGYKKERGYSLVPSGERKNIKKEIVEIGVVLQKRRKELGYTQEKLAEMLRVSAVGIRHIERGVRSPSLPMLVRLTKKLRLKIELFPIK